MCVKLLMNYIFRTICILGKKVLIYAIKIALISPLATLLVILVISEANTTVAIITR